MTQADTAPGDVTVLVPTGMLGAGVQRKHIRYGIAAGAHAIAADSGSTDSGPSYLARGVSKMNRESIKRDLDILMDEAFRAKIPLLIGTCGTSGTDPGSTGRGTLPSKWRASWVLPRKSPVSTVSRLPRTSYRRIGRAR